jgi:hypothetical protein
MSNRVLGKIREALKGKEGPFAPTIEQDLRFHEAKLADLESKRGDLVLAIQMGEDGAQAALDTWREAVEAERRLVSDLRAGVVSARERDQAADRERRAKANASQVASLRQRLHARDAIVAKLCQDIANAAMRWQDILAANEGIRGLLGELQLHGLIGVYTRDGELRAGIEQEIFRVGSGPRGRNGVGFPLVFPGGKVARLEWSNDPDIVPALHDEVVKATAYIVEMASGASPSRSPPAPASVASPEAEPAPLNTGDATADPDVLTSIAGPDPFRPLPPVQMRLTDD